jgi:hypothetical protein
MGGVHAVHLDSMMSTWTPGGIQVELDRNLAGLPAKKFHLESRWNDQESMGECKVLTTRTDASRYATHRMDRHGSAYDLLLPRTPLFLVSLRNALEVPTSSVLRVPSIHQTCGPTFAIFSNRTAIRLSYRDGYHRTIAPHNVSRPVYY